MGGFSEIDAGLRPAPSVRGSETSLAAAVSISGNRNGMHDRIMRFLLAHPEGATDEQIQIGIDMNPSTERPRRGELEQLGKIKNSGRKARTLSKRSAVIWIVACPKL